MTHCKEETVPDRNVFSNDLDKAYSDMEKELKKTFECTECISFTADMQTGGMTAQWIHPCPFQMEKAANTCE